MWHLRASPSPSTTFYRSSGEYTSSSSNEYSSANTAFDSDTEKNGPHSLDGYSFGFGDNTSDKHSSFGRKWRSPRLKRSVNKGRNKLKQLFSLDTLRQNTYYNLLLLRLRLRNYVSKRLLCFLIIASTLLVSLRQLYSPLAYHSAPPRWAYLVENNYDFVSDSKVVDMLQLVFDNEDLYGKYLFQKNFRDKRITPARYLNHLMNHITERNGGVSESLKYEFSWSDWINFDERLLPSMDYLLKHNGLPISNCSQFETEIGFPTDNIFKVDFLSNCSDLTASEIYNMANLNYPHFKAMAPLDNFELPIEARIVHGATYVYHTQLPPERLIFVDGSSKSDFIIPVANTENVHKEPVLPEWNADESDGDISLPALNDLVAKIVDQLPPSDVENVYNREITVDIARINRNLILDDSTFTLNKHDFENPRNLSQIRASLSYPEEEGSLDANLYANILSEMETYPDGDYPKYFHEPRLSDKKIGGSHYDWRFFNIKEIDNEYKRLSTLNRLIRAWLRFTNNENIHTWLAHGTLLGYSFNGFMLPWDYDHDVQVSSSAMWRMAKYYNQSLIVDCTSDDQYSSGYGQYFLDISSNFFNRTNSNGNNAIDARFIDIHTGMYIDITQLSDVINKEETLKHDLVDFGKVLKQEFYRLLKQQRISIDGIIEEDNLVSCKNHHFYRLEDFEQFEKHIFEGEYAYVPKHWPDILDREFPKRKTAWKHEGYTWRSQLELWVFDKRCSKRSFDRTGTSCSDDRFVSMMKLLLNNSEDRRAVLPDWEGVAAVDLRIAEIGNSR